MARMYSLRFIGSRLLWATRLCNLFVIDKGGFKLRFHPTALSASYWVNSNAREEDEAFISSYLQPGDVMIDVGANIGALTLAAAAAVGPAGRVFSVEAHPRTFHYLKSNIGLNRFDNIELHNRAVGAAPGMVFFSDRRSDDQNAVVDEGAIRVPVETLDALLSSKVEKVTLLKVDVEGYEKFVFEGAKAILSRTELVYFEAWEPHFRKFRYATTDLQRLLRGAGFRLFRRANSALVELPEGYVANECVNLLAVRDVGKVREKLAAAIRAETVSMPKVRRSANIRASCVSAMACSAARVSREI